MNRIERYPFKICPEDLGRMSSFVPKRRNMFNVIVKWSVHNCVMKTKFKGKDLEEIYRRIKNNMAENNIYCMQIISIEIENFVSNRKKASQ